MCVAGLSRNLIEMGIQEHITPLILTYNEAPNIARTLDKLRWARRIVVIDSLSTDDTVGICAQYPRVQIFQRKFDTAANQDNFGLEQVQTDWVLSMDADYVLSDLLISELANLPSMPTVDGYFIRFRYCVFGKPLRSTILPPRCSLYRRAKAVYKDDGHTQRVVVDGQIGQLKQPIFHDDRKPLARWLASQDRYTEKEVAKLLVMPPNQLSFNDRLRRRKWIAPPLVFFYTLIVRGNLFDGWRGWYYVLQRTLAESLLSLRLIECDRPETH